MTTKLQRLSVSGLVPGQTHCFRQKATNNGQTAIASAPVAIWGASAVVLEVAA